MSYRFSTSHVLQIVHSYKIKFRKGQCNTVVFTPLEKSPQVMVLKSTVVETVKNNPMTRQLSYLPTCDGIHVPTMKGW